MATAARGGAPRPPSFPGQSRSRRLRPLVAVVPARLARPRGVGTRRRRRPGRPASHGPARRGGAVRARDRGADPRRHPGGRGRRGAGGRGGGGGGGTGLGGPLSVPQPRLGQRQRGGAEPRAQVSAAAGPWPGWEPPTPSPGRTRVGGAQLRGHSGSSPPPTAGPGRCSGPSHGVRTGFWRLLVPGSAAFNPTKALGTGGGDLRGLDVGMLWDPGGSPSWTILAISSPEGDSPSLSSPKDPPKSLAQPSLHFRSRPTSP